MTELFKPRTLISFLLYGTFCYLAIIGKIDKEAVIAVVSCLMGHYFGKKGNGDVKKTV